ncbi:MAG TPA: hypothetical protein VKE94_18215, partial [Gemmataceae bacterium]|nr:hypothetical protein [Gemmataceae bacterium]
MLRTVAFTTLGIALLCTSGPLVLGQRGGDRGGGDRGGGGRGFTGGGGGNRPASSRPSGDASTPAINRP